MFKFDLDGIDNLKQRLQRHPQEFKSRMSATLNSHGASISGDAKKRLDGTRDGGGVDTGRYRASIRHKVKATDSTVELEVGGNTTYGSVIEFGRKPNRPAPPISALLPWVRRKRLSGLKVRAKLGTARRAQQEARRDSVERSIAYLIARKIGREGTRPRPHLKPAFEADRQRLLDDIKQTLRELVLLP